MRVKSFRYLIWLLMVNFLLTVLLACSSQKNKDITVKADLVVKAKKDKSFTGVRFTVENGVVTLTGVSPTEKTKSTVEETVKKVWGVKEVVNNITIGPVVIGTDEPLRERVDSVLKEYAAVQAIVVDSTVLLEGKVENAESGKLLSSIQQLKPKSVETRITLQ